ncbi:MAG TPA: hypothetical protein VN577_19410 [Terriglobales bacterium]|nr:hypothetical protein [Terriglobales bacterium]
MNTIAAAELAAFPSALASAGRSPEIPESDDIYGFLVGSWELDIRVYWQDISELNLKAEAHFGWVLEGRAIQDVWIIPRPEHRGSMPNPNIYAYGTTMRVYDPKLRAWHVTWINPVTGQRNELTGRRIGNDIVQIGALPDGTPIRWNFTEITQNSFRWTGETLQPDGHTWLLQGKFHAHRIR